jgi:sterol desaturase/sphingolipid hydroxylase (fatty acid hydroxylase superfamily)
MLGIPIGLIYTNAGEWLIHKYILHGLGRKKSSFWSFHWHEHHRESRKAAMIDKHYEKPLRGWNAQTKEALALFLTGVAHAPLFPLFPFFTGTVWYSMFNYYRVHRRSHLDPKWAEENLPWHVDHHLGSNQDANWCVTRPWFDEWMGTRIPRSAMPQKKAKARPVEPVAAAAH